MPFSAELPEWNAPGVSPPQILKDSGWLAGMKPPDAYFNWFMYRTYLALMELQQNAVNKEDGLVVGDGTTSTKGIVQLSSATDSDSETLAATPKAVKAAYDRAEEAFQSVSNGKQAISVAITDVDPSVVIQDADEDGTPTFEELATAIRSISTGEPLTGTVMSSASTKSFRSFSNSYAEYYVQVTGLPFVPSTVVLKKSQSITVFSNLIPESVGYEIVALASSTVYERDYRVNDPDYPTNTALVNEDGFLLPVTIANQTYAWVAYP